MRNFSLNLLRSLIAILIVGSTLLSNKVMAQTVLYVSPDGSGNSFSTCQPGKLTDAIAQVKALTQNQTGDLTVALFGGIYDLKSPLQFSDEDGGKNNFKVIYKPATSSDIPILEGGKKISGWQPFNSKLWVADASGIDDCRQMWVNNYRATRAQSNQSYVTRAWDDKATQYSIDGVLLAKTSVPNFDQLSNLEDVELNFYYNWKQDYIPLASVTTSGNDFLIKPQQPWFAESLIWGGHGVKPRDDVPYFIVNAFELLDKPGEWYFNRQTKKIYYYPRSSDDLAKDVVYVGHLEHILDFKGSSLENKVKNMRFEGLTLRHSSWLQPNEMGYSIKQADGATFGYVSPVPMSPRWSGDRLYQMPGAVVATRASNIELVNNRIAECGAGGIILFGQGNDNWLIQGNNITDISGSGIVIGNYLHDYMNDGNAMGDDLKPDFMHTMSPDKEALCLNDKILNNYIHRIGVEYWGSIGIFSPYHDNLEIAYNEIVDVPYSGVAFGFFDGENTGHILKVHHNKIHYILRKVSDGGAYYTFLYKGHAELNNNYMYDGLDGAAIGAWIYLDNESSNASVHDNVVGGCNWIWQRTLQGADNNVFEHNFSCSSYRQDGGKNTFINNQEGVNVYIFPEAVDIMNNSGLQAEYQNLINANPDPLAVSAYQNCAEQCTIKGIDAITTECSDGKFNLSGNVTISNLLTSDTLVIQSGSQIQKFTGALTSPVSYTLSGLLGDGSNQTVTCTILPGNSCRFMQIYKAPDCMLNPVKVLDNPSPGFFKVNIASQPFSTTTKISTSNRQTITSVSIFGLDGRRLYTNSTIGVSEIEIGSELITGIYIVQVESGIQFSRMKIIKK